MGSNSNVGVPSGGTIPVDAFQLSDGDYQQLFRQAPATAVSLNSWTVTTAGQASQVAADVNRVRVLMVNTSSGRVYLRFDNTVPSASAHQWFLEPGERYEVPLELVTLAISMTGASATGLVLTTLATSS